MIALLLTGSPNVSDEDLAQRAKSSMQSGIELRAEPRKAVPLLESSLRDHLEILNRGGRNADLYFNLGNLSFLLNRLPEAIFFYRLGLQIDPSQSTVRENLRLAREQVVYPTGADFARPPVDARPPWLPRLRLQWWMFIPLWCGYLIGWILLTRWRMLRKSGLFWAGILTQVLTLLLTAAFLLVDYYDRPGTFPLMVIKMDGVILRKGDGNGYPPAQPAPMNRGVEAELLFKRGDWIQIRLADDTTGWIPAKMAIVEEQGRS